MNGWPDVSRNYLIFTRTPPYSHMRSASLCYHVPMYPRATSLLDALQAYSVAIAQDEIVSETMYEGDCWGLYEK